MGDSSHLELYQSIWRLTSPHRHTVENDADGVFAEFTVPIETDFSDESSLILASRAIIRTACFEEDVHAVLNVDLYSDQLPYGFANPEGTDDNHYNVVVPIEGTPILIPHFYFNVISKTYQSTLANLQSGTIPSGFGEILTSTHASQLASAIRNVDLSTINFVS